MSKNRLKINLITHDNGVGLTADVKIVKGILKEHTCKFVEVWESKCEDADLNIHFEVLDAKFYKYAPRNLFFPNPEWFWFPKELKGIDVVLAKTRDAETIFNRYGCETVYTSFTSIDRRADVKKHKVYLHIAGQSRSKGTSAVFAAWRRDYPAMIFTKLRDYERFQAHHENIYTKFARMSDKELSEIISKCYFHLCPSEYEGFGHGIWEAKSTGGIVITTDAPPMNETVTEGVDGFLVKPTSYKRMNIAKTAIIAYRDLQAVVEKTFDLTEAELKGMSAASRRRWEENDKYFKTMLIRIINEIA